MKLSHKLMMVSAAVLLGVSPVLGMSANNAPVQAARKSSIHNTYGGQRNKVRLTKSMKFVNQNGKRTSKTAPKNGRYIIWNVKNINGRVYYSIETDLKYWIPATATVGTVSYKSGSTTYTLRTNGKSVKTTTASKKSRAKKSTKKTSTSKKSSAKKSAVKKTTSKKSTSSAKKTSRKSSSNKKAATNYTLTLNSDAFEYDENGRLASTDHLDKNAEVKAKGTKTIAGQAYYALNDGNYLKASDVAKVNGKTVSANASSSKKATAKKSTKKAATKSTKKSTSKKTIKVAKIIMKRRAYVYDPSGKRVKNYLGTHYVGKGITVRGLGTKTIKGVKYYALQPNHYYVKASDVRVK